jgi:eukaryotic-like serine/threonine-protein kinase
MAKTAAAQFTPEPRPVGGRYRLVEPLGTGGFGQTFRAQDLHLPGHPLCVVKQLQPQVTSAEELAIARRLFDTEAQTLYELGAHPQIPGLLAHVEEDQEFYLAQELVHGHSLAEELGTPWSDAQVTALLGDLLGILAFVHSHGVIHRDIKPSNLLRRTSDHRIVLIDFGAVKQVGPQSITQRSGLSHTISIGTQGYMPSEQIAGRPQFSSDIYAVGILGIQALTGYAPTDLHPHPHSGELEWHQYAPQAHPSLVEVLDTMVRYDFRTRYTTAAEALVALRGLPPQLSQYVPEAIAPSGQSPPVMQANPTVAVGRRRTNPQLTAPQTSPQAPARRREQSPAPMAWLPLMAGATVAIAALLGWQLWHWAAAPKAIPPTIATTPADEPVAEESTMPEATTPPPEDRAVSPEVEAVEATSPASPVTHSPQPSATAATSPSPSSASNGELTPEAAQAVVSALYGYVSNQAWDAARSQFDSSLAQQFNPNFFTQFDRVSVENLRVTGQTPNTVELLGENTYFYPDGATQREQRSFTVQLQDGQPRIVASAFREVLKPR